MSNRAKNCDIYLEMSAERDAAEAELTTLLRDMTFYVSNEEPVLVAMIQAAIDRRAARLDPQEVAAYDAADEYGFDSTKFADEHYGTAVKIETPTAAESIEF